MKLVLQILFLAVLVLLPLKATAQAMPNHFDPNARELELDLSSVPTIRFLTSPDYPPFNYRDEDGELVGYNIDLARRVCDILEIACTMQSWPWEQVADALDDNQGDVLLAGLAISPANGERFDFSHIYLQFPARFVTQKPNVENFSSDMWQNTGQQILGEVQDLVAVRAGSNHQKFLERYFPLASIIEFLTEYDALEAVSTGAAYAYFGDALRSSFWLNNNPNCCAFTGEAYFHTELFGSGLAAAFPAGHDPVRRAFNTALLRLQRAGILDTLYLKWFPVGFY